MNRLTRIGDARTLFDCTKSVVIVRTTSKICTATRVILRKTKRSRAYGSDVMKQRSAGDYIEEGNCSTMVSR